MTSVIKDIKGIGDFSEIIGLSELQKEMIDM